MRLFPISLQHIDGHQIGQKLVLELVVRIRTYWTTNNITINSQLAQVIEMELCKQSVKRYFSTLEIQIRKYSLTINIWTIHGAGRTRYCSIWMFIYVKKKNTSTNIEDTWLVQKTQTWVFIFYFYLNWIEVLSESQIVSYHPTILDRSPHKIIRLI